MAFIENKNYYSNWDQMSSNDQFLNSFDKFMYNTSDTVWNNATGQYEEHQGYMNVGGKDLSDGGRDPRARQIGGGGRCRRRITGPNGNKWTCKGRKNADGECIPCDGKGFSWNNASGVKDLYDGGRDPRESGQVTAGGDSGCVTCGLGSSCNAPATCQGGCCIQKLTEKRGGSGSGYNNASGCGYSNAAGGPSINVGGETFNMQPTLAWNQGDFFGEPQGFGASQTSCAPCPQGFQGDRQSCGGTGCYNSLGQRMYESGTGIPQGMSVQYTQV
jgi:hypothetical protein